MRFRSFALLLLCATFAAAAETPSEAPKEVASTSTDTKLAITVNAVEPAVLPVLEAKPQNACAKAAVAGEKTGAECKVNWTRMTRESVTFMGMQHWMNKSTYKGELKGPFVRDWFSAVANTRFSRWTDGDPFIVDYVGHPMSGATYARTFIQNDPKGASLELGMNKAYWKSRAKGMAWAAFWSTQWEIGPVSEASLGNLGNFKYASNATGAITNGTGLTDFVTTPVGGTLWVVGEDAIDKFVTKRLDRKYKNPVALLGISVLTPTRSVANLLRFKAPWYRESRAVGGWERFKSW